MDESFEPAICGRRWIFSGRNISQNEASNFTVASYNILADKHICNYYPYVLENERFMIHRHPKILKEIQYINCDIVCLQEVEKSYFHDQAVPDLHTLGYSGVFHMRNSVEGLAVFYLKNKFTHIEEKYCSLNSVEPMLLGRKIDKTLTYSLDEFLQKTPGGILMVKLKLNNSNKELTVGCLHIWFDQLKQPDVLAMQTCVAVREIARYADCLPFILCGDFNLEPISPGYEVLTTGNLSLETRKKLENATKLTKQNGEEVSLVNAIPELFSHSINVKSSYRNILECEPELTCCSDADPYFPYIGCLDYICYSPEVLEPFAVLKPVTADKVKEEYALPNTVFPSDHILMAAIFHCK